MICQYIETKKEEFGAWPVCKVADWRRSQDRPEHLAHARRSRPPSARSLRDETLKAEISDETLKAEISDETLKAEISKVHKNQLLGAGGPHDARDAGPP